MPPKEGLLLINFYFTDKNLDPSTAGPIPVSVLFAAVIMYFSQTRIANKLIERDRPII